MGEDVTEFLEHYGVKGQKWGIRNKKDYPKSADAKKADALRGRPVHSLSNKQLKTLNERSSLESNHARLHPGKVMSGKQKAEMILGTLGVGVTAYNLFKSPAGAALVKAGKVAATKIK